MKRALIVTTFNEAKSIGQLVDDVCVQTVVPDRLVVVDAGSTDGTAHIVSQAEPALARSGCQLVVISRPGAGIAKGRNIAIDTADADAIASTDAGCRLDPRWFELITSPIALGEADLVGGFFLPVSHSRFQRVVGALTTDPTPRAEFLPSSRSVAFTRRLWQLVGGYPEDLPWGEDTEFNRRCLVAGARYAVAANAIVHWEVRGSLAAVSRQFYRYAFGDGLARRLSRSHVLTQGVGWSATLAALAGAYWISGFAIASLVLGLLFRHRKKLVFVDLPLAALVVLSIQVPRFVGFVVGVARGSRLQPWRPQV